MNDIITITTYLIKIAALILSIWHGYKFFSQDKYKLETIWDGVAAVLLYVVTVLGAQNG